MIDLYTLNSKSFSDQLHTGFTVHAGDSAVLKLELIEVNAPTSPPHVELFSLQFRGPASPRLNQQIHRFEHEKLGVFELFVTVIGEDASGTLYEVVFHRLRKKS